MSRAPGRLLSILALVFAVSSSAVAAGNDDALSITGFYTLDGTYADDDIGLLSNAGLVRRYEEGAFNGYNSVVGLQVSSRLTDALTATIQGAAFFDNRDEVDTSLDWAYLSYDFGNDTIVRAGRFQIPLLKGTELRKVGYTRLLARPLTPGVGAGGFNDHHGVEVIRNVARQSHAWELQAAFGEPHHNLSMIDGYRMGLLSAAYVRDNLWIRGSAFRADFSASRRIPGSTSVREEEDDVVMGSLEAELEIAEFVINAGYVDSSSRVIPDDTMSYLSVGRRIGRFTPFLFHADFTQRFGAARRAAPAAGAPAGRPPPSTGGPPPRPGRPPPSRAGLTADREAVGAGVRWDVRENLAIKFQYEKVTGDSFTRDPSTLEREDGDSFTITVEGVFR